MDVSLKDGEHIEWMDDRLRLIVGPGRTFGTDALLLAAFALPGKNDIACDLGTGCGVIPFYWRSRGAGRRLYGVELEPAAAEMLRRSAALNALGDGFVPIEGDLRALAGILPAGGFDVVCMNPPYTGRGAGIESGSAPARLARHESETTLAEICAAAARLTRFGGRFCLCLRPERLTEAMHCLRAADLEPKRLRFVAKQEGAAPWLFLLEGKKGRRPGLTVEPELHLYTPAGLQSPELQAIVGSYADSPPAPATERKE